MQNSYYLIRLPADKSKTRLNDFLAKGFRGRLPDEIMHYRFNKDMDKVIVQGAITDDCKGFIMGKGFIQYLGDNVNGVADKSVFDFLQANQAEWPSAPVEE